MSNYACLERYIPLVEFMGKICGKNYEIILHDVSTPERSVIAACNEHLSGRRIGDPMTELAKELLRTGVYQEHDYVANYEGRTRGGKRFVSSTYFIKEKGHLVGLICVNHDVEDILVLSEHLSSLLHSFSLPQEEESSAYTENLDDSIPELSSNLIHSTILGYGIPSDAMHTADKLEILRSLEAQGVFHTKGSIGQVARELHISEPTVYRTCGVSAAKQYDLPPRRFTCGRDALTSRCVKWPARNISFNSSYWWIPDTSRSLWLCIYYDYASDKGGLKHEILHSL